MKYFKHLFDSTAQALVAVFYEQRHADKVLEHYFKTHKKWGKRDRQFVAETVYGCVRWWNQYLHLGGEGHTELETAHRAMGVHLVLNDQPLPDWYADFYKAEDIIEKKKNLIVPHLVHAVPEWLYQRGSEELGESTWNACLQELNKTASVVLRANTLKNTAKAVQSVLNAQQIESQLLGADYPDALVLSQRANVFRTSLFQNGGFEVQDASSQLVGPLLNPEPGSRVIDACAGAGGKSLHLASLMKNKGKIISMDLVEWKLDELKRRAKRAGVSVIETRLIENNKVIKRLQDSADYLLLDVPCTGLGVLKRNPDTKWKLTLQGLQELHKVQQEILQNYSSMLKKGGKLLYATCSILPSENQNQVSTFIDKNPGWKLLNEKRVLPSESPFDGFYMALLSR